MTQDKPTELRDLLEKLEDYFDNFSDVVDGDYGEPKPNKEMQFLVEIRAALAASLNRQGWTREVEDLKLGIEYWSGKHDEVVKWLWELVDLKELKDTQGKTEEYLQRQPIAWKRAKELIASYQNVPDWMPLPNKPEPI